MTLFYMDPNDPNEITPPSFKSVFGFDPAINYEVEIKKLKEMKTQSSNQAEIDQKIEEFETAIVMKNNYFKKYSQR